MSTKAWDRLQKQIIESKKDVTKRCIYCGKLFKPTEGISAYDYGLHFESSKGRCCTGCHELVTVTNTIIANAIHASDDTEKKAFIEEAIEHLVELNDLLNGGMVDVDKGI